MMKVLIKGFSPRDNPLFLEGIKEPGKNRVPLPCTMPGRFCIHQVRKFE